MIRRAPPLLRILLGSLVPTAPAAVVFVALVVGGEIAALTAIVAVILVYLATTLLLGPLFSGLAQVKAALAALSAGATTLPEIRTFSPTARELGRDLGRAARAIRETVSRSEDARAGAEAVVATLPEPLLLIDQERRIVRANPGATALLGPRLAGRDLAAVLRLPPLLEAADAVLRGGDARVVEVDLPGPVERHLAAQLGPLRPPIQDGAALAVMLTDVTALKRSERMRQDFVANASHELRTPLATLLGFIETLRGPAREDEAARERFLSIMAEQAGRMARLVDDLLSLSRIELNEHLPPTQHVDVHRLLATVADTLEQRAAKRGMKIELAPAAPMAEVAGDPDELTQVFQNLIDNAIKYGRTGTVVEVAATLSPRRLAGAAALQVTVRDHGEGIPREQIPRLTERFYRADPARSRELGGTGLGLAIVKHIVNHHRGALEISSELGAGSAFTVHLPLAESA